MESLIKLDHTLFKLINSDLKTGFLDTLMPIITRDTNLFFLILLLLVVIFLIYRKRDIRGLVTLIILVFFSDFCTEKFKALFTRPRPCLSVEGANLLVGCSASYSFPSGHATNIFTAMVFLSLKYPKLSPLLLFIAFLVAYSRVYVGVHFPVDITAGALLGTIIAMIGKPFQ